MAFDTTANILNDAAGELALLSSPLTDPYASTDPNLVQLRALLKRVGRSLVRAHPWTQLQQEYSFATVASTADYALPADFDRVLDRSQWNRTGVQALVGPVSGPQWQALQARGSTPLWNRLYRQRGNRLWLFPTPSAAESIYLEYISTYWVQPTGQTAPTTATPSAATDTLWFDEHLLVLGLKLAFLRAKGFASQGAQEEFNTAWSATTGSDGGASVLNITHSVRDLDDPRTPDTGWGL